MQFDATTIILAGGSVLIGLVVLHGIVSVLRRKRLDSASEGAAPASPAEQGSLPFAEEAEPGATDNRNSPPTGGKTAIEPTVGRTAAAQAGAADDARAGEDDAVLGRLPLIPGKRTEPTVPRHARPVNYATEEVAKSKPSSDASGLEDVLVIFVFAEAGARLDGERLLGVFDANQLEYDGRKFLRRDPNTGRVRFMVANGVNPGSFDLSDVKAMSTPGIVLLLRMSDSEDPSDAFEDMLEVALEFASDLGGELKDERMSTMSGQTIEHNRQRIRDYKRTLVRK